MIDVVWIILTCIVCYVFISALIRPGSVDIVTPSHSDLFRYFIISQDRWQLSSWLAPRPFMLAYLKLFGIFKSSDVLYMCLALPALAFLTLVTLVCKTVLGQEISPITVIVLAATSIGSPMFYPLFQYDYGGMLSGAFATAAILLAIRLLSAKQNGISIWIRVAVLVWLSVDTKPTFGAMLIALACLTVIFDFKRNSILLLTVTIAVVAAVMTKDVVLGSSFIRSADAHSDYSVAIAPMKNLRVLYFYVANAITYPLLLSTAVGLITILIVGGWRTATYFIVAILSASAPMALLVNREWDIYAWYSTVVIALMIAFAVQLLLNHLKSNISLTNKAVSISVIALVLIGLGGHMISKSVTTEWTIENQQYNRNVLSMLAALPAATPGRLLFVGVHGPYNPLKNTHFIALAYPNVGPFDVVLTHAEDEWNAQAHEQTNGIYPDAIVVDRYTRIVVIDPLGNLAQQFSPESFSRLSLLSQRITLACGVIGTSDDAITPDFPQIVKTLGCLTESKDYATTIAVGQQYLSAGVTQPWIYYFVGKAEHALGHPQEAHQMLSKALAAEPTNVQFAKALVETQAK